MSDIRRQSLHLASAAIVIVVTTAYAQEGIWKSLVPAAGTMHGEFQNDDPLGLAAGAEIKADCSLY
jgi:hypothetical protein